MVHFCQLLICEYKRINGEASSHTTNLTSDKHLPSNSGQLYGSQSGGSDGLGGQWPEAILVYVDPKTATKNKSII